MRRRFNKDLVEILQLIGEEQGAEIQLESGIYRETMIDIM